MSGTFEELHVPPTLVSFAVAPVDVNHETMLLAQNLKNQVIVFYF